MCRHESHSFLNAELDPTTLTLLASIARDGVHLHRTLPCWSCGSLSAKEIKWVAEHLQDTSSCCHRMPSLIAFLSNGAYH